MNGILWFGAGVVATVVCFIVAGIVIAKRQHRLKFFADVVLPEEKAMIVRLLRQVRTLPADEHRANLELLRHLGMIQRVGDTDILTPFGTQVARHIEAQGHE